jgi:hypothetical protein
MTVANDPHAEEKVRAAERECSTCNRRDFIFGSFSLALSHWGDQDNRRELRPLDRFNSILRRMQKEPRYASSFRANDERIIAMNTGPERAPIRAAKSTRTISSRASDLILASEITSETIYARRYCHPVWPRGQSGITIGIGYDLGEANETYFREDWSDYIDSRAIDILSKTCGASGEYAARVLKVLPRLNIPWEIAFRQYDTETLPRYIGETEASLPNTSLVGPDCLGALVSLVYNRGATFSSPESRYDEMRAVKAHMNSKAFEQVPEDLRHMERLWNSDSALRGVALRREAEAALFEFGLST